MGSDPCGRKAQHTLILLTDPTSPQRPGYVGIGRLGRPAEWETVWRFRDKIDTPLAQWLRMLPVPPRQDLLIGSVGMPRGMVRMLVNLTSAWFPTAAVDQVRIGRYRPTGQVTAAGLRRWDSRGEAAAALGVSRWAILQRVKNGTLLNLT